MRSVGPGRASPALFFIRFRTPVRKRTVQKEKVMSGLWLLVLPLAGLAGYLVRDALLGVPRSNDDFVFC